MAASRGRCDLPTSLPGAGSGSCKRERGSSSWPGPASRGTTPVPAVATVSGSGGRKGCLALDLDPDPGMRHEQSQTMEETNRFIFSSMCVGYIILRLICMHYHINRVD